MMHVQTSQLPTLQTMAAKDKQHAVGGHSTATSAVKSARHWSAAQLADATVATSGQVLAKVSLTVLLCQISGCYAHLNYQSS
jgi:hypothetical protein